MKLFEDQFVVVTGGAGFIGSCIIRYLNEQGLSNIIVVDDLKTGEKWKNLQGKQFVDVISKKDIFKWLDDRSSEVEAFVHLGACSVTTEIDADYLLSNNYRFSVDLVEYALRHGHRFIYASSAATYGDGSLGFSDDQSKLDTLRPLNMYGYSKQLFDLWLKRQGGLDKVVGLKYFNVFGPNEYHKGKMASAIIAMTRLILKEGKARLFKSNVAGLGDGMQTRDFIYVKDVVRMTCAFLNNDICGIFNIGSGKATTWIELAEAVFKALNKPVNIEYIDMPAELIGKYQNYSQADMNKTKKVLKSDAKCMPIETAVADYVSNYLVPGTYW